MKAAQKPEALLKEAKALHTRAERNDDLRAYAAARAAYQQYMRQRAAAQLGLPADTLQALGDCCQSAAKAVLGAARALPDAQLTREREAAAQGEARALLRSAGEAYSEALRSCGDDRDGAHGVHVQAGNALAESAEVADGAAAAEALLRSSIVEYQAALALQPGDSLVLTNVGDALMALGEGLAASPATQAEAGAAYEAGRAAFREACGACAGQEGEELPGLLHNWGVGLHSAGTHTQDKDAAIELLAEAALRLDAAAAFQRGDAAPLRALGDVLAALAERVPLGEEQPPSSAPDHWIWQLLRGGRPALLAAALERAFQPALAIDAGDADAWVGLAEAHHELARAGGADAGRQHLEHSRAAYARALQHPQALGSLSERGDVRFNAACVAAQLSTVTPDQGQAAACAREAHGLLGGLLRLGLISPAEVLAEADFAAVRQEDWFRELLQPG